MRRKKAFTLIELLVVISIIALLVSILMPALSRAREQSERAGCLINLKNLGRVWMLYAEDNSDEIVLALPGNNGWIGWPGLLIDQPNRTVYEKDCKAAMENGQLWKYMSVYDIYCCPTAEPGEWITYSIPDSLNGYSLSNGGFDIPGGAGRYIKKMTQIAIPSTRALFLDEGFLTHCSFTIYNDREQFWDQVPVRHHNGMTFSFSDGHSEYWKWQDQRTIEFGLMNWQDVYGIYQPVSPGNTDLHRLQRACWGSLAYTP